MPMDVEASVMRKVAWRLIPFLSLGYLINALDRFNISIAALTMNQELGLSATTYGLAAGAFFWSYVLFQVPASAILTRIGARRWLGVTMIAWGFCSAGTAFVTGATSFVAMRFLLGIAESGFFPGVAWFMTRWFPSRHRGRAMGIFYAFGASASVIGGPLSGNLLLLHGWHGLSGWQWVFLIEGVPACLLAVLCPVLMRDRPEDAGWLQPAEQRWLRETLDAESKQSSSQTLGLMQAMVSPMIMILILGYLLIGFGVYSKNFLALIAFFVEIVYSEVFVGLEFPMDVSAFASWLDGIAALTQPQRRQAWQALALSEAVSIGVAETSASFEPIVASVEQASTPNEMPALASPPLIPSSDLAGAAAVAALGQRRVDSVGCPHCDSHAVVRWGKASDLPRYRCKACQRTFNALTRTPLAHLRMKDKWATQAEALIEGVSTAKAAKRCEVHYTTAFRWRHRFLKALASDKPKTLSGIVEGDETFILESFKGKRSGLPRKARKRGGKSAKRGLSAEQIPVIVARDRHGATTDAVLPKLNRLSIAAALGSLVTPANEFCCDGGNAIVAFGRRAGIPTHILPAPGKPNPQTPDFHINNVNAYHSRLKEWLRRFHGVATKNLPHYLGWRRALEALGQNVTSDGLILGAIGLGPYQQLTR